MLLIQDVVKTFGQRHAVDGVSLRLEPGVIGLIGHNGAGKSTLMQMLATLTRPTSGRILLDGQDIVAKPELMRRRLGYLPQDFGVYPHLTALEFLQYFAALKGVRSRLHEVLERVNLHEQARRPAATFSGGMRQRLGIAQALLGDPDVLIVDEPTAGLDPEERLRLRHLLGDLGRQRLVIVSTHIVSDIENMPPVWPSCARAACWPSRRRTPCSRAPPAGSGRRCSRPPPTRPCAAGCRCCRPSPRAAGCRCAWPIRRSPVRKPSRPRRAWRRR